MHIAGLSYPKLETPMQKASPHATRPLGRRIAALTGALLITVLALTLAACNPVSAPQDQPVAEPTAPAAEAAEETAVPAEEAAEPAAEPVDEEAIQKAIAPFLVETAPSEEFDGVPVGFTTSGLAYRGDPNAPVIMIEFSDLQCPYCARHFTQTDPAITDKYVRDGQLRIVFNDYPIEQLHPVAPDAHAAGLCVAEQGSAATYWKMHGELFVTADEWGTSRAPQDVFSRLAEESGAAMDKFEECIDNGSTAELVAERVINGQRRGISGTPSFQFVRVDDGALFSLVGAQPFEAFQGLIDAILAGESPEALAQAEAEAQPQQEIPFWAAPEGLAADPARPGYNMAGDQYAGSLDAPITMIEFADFQCPYCKQHAQTTQPVLDEQYVNTGKVLRVFKHFPLTQIHPAAPNAAVAAECAAEQGKFWEMYELLFAEQATWSVANPDAALITLAEQLGLDIEAFGACQIDPAIAERVDSDLQDGASLISSTPSFVILFAGQGTIAEGAYPAEAFTEVFDQILEMLEAN